MATEAKKEERKHDHICKVRGHLQAICDTLLKMHRERSERSTVGSSKEKEMEKGKQKELEKNESEANKTTRDTWPGESYAHCRLLMQQYV